jgi:hypothetical protein
MVRFVLTLGVLLLGVLVALAPVAGAEEAKKEAPKDGKVLETKSEAYQSAAAIDFASALGLPFPSLTTLGGRIEAARLATDPVALAVAAHELSVAEKVSGKKAGITCDALAKEAVELATVRGRSSELKAVALLAKGEARKELTMLAAKAVKTEAEDAKRAELGDAPRGIRGELVVNNHSRHGVVVFVNGARMGWVREGQRAHFHLHTHGETRLMAEGGGRHWHEHVRGEFNRYEWRLHH